MPAGRPFNRRTAESFTRDVEAINRVRTAIFLDGRLPDTDKHDAMVKLESAAEAVMKLRNYALEEL
jgi:hypothetical protein